MNWLLSAASIIIFSATVCLSAPAVAAVPDHVAARLNGDLTPLGAERGGDALGLIPAWTANQHPPEAEAYPANPELAPAPFAGDAVLTTITAENADRFADRLTATHKTLLATYPDSYSMPVYRSRRTCRTPTAVHEATFSNATSAALAEGGNGVVGATSGTPFPIPNSAYEIIWNHLLAYRNHNAWRRLAISTPGKDKNRVLYSYEEKTAYLWAGDVFGEDNRFRMTDEERHRMSSFYRLYLRSFFSLAPYTGRVNLEWHSLNETRTSSKQWEYRSETRRVRRAPEAAYEVSLPLTRDIVTYDSRFGFDGPPNRFEWSVVGHRDYYLPNNNNTLTSQDGAYDALLSDYHVKQDLTRYELQRVWVLEANLKDGFQHRFYKRRFYIQEDSWQILATELYDSGGNLVSGQELFPAQSSQRGLCEIATEVTYDLTNKRYVARQLLSQESKLDHIDEAFLCDFRPASIRASHACGR